MAELKTKPTDVDVHEHLAGRANAQQLSDCHMLMAILERVTGEQPVMWGPSIVGYGRYRYVYASGHGGEMPVVGFAVRGREIVVYVNAECDEQRARPGRRSTSTPTTPRRSRGSTWAWA